MWTNVNMRAGVYNSLQTGGSDVQGLQTVEECTWVYSLGMYAFVYRRGVRTAGTDRIYVCSVGYT
jgi:hypothetical protein